jgi:hypothetical protein
MLVAMYFRVGYGICCGGVLLPSHTSLRQQDGREGRVPSGGVNSSQRESGLGLSVVLPGCAGSGAVGAHLAEAECGRRGEGVRAHAGQVTSLSLPTLFPSLSPLRSLSDGGGLCRHSKVNGAEERQTGEALSQQQREHLSTAGEARDVGNDEDAIANYVLGGDMTSVRCGVICISLTM